MLIGRRELLASAVASALYVRPLRARPASSADIRPGERALGLGSDRDGLIYVPANYKAGTPMPLVVLPQRVRGKPRIFSSHGTEDPVMPIATTGRDVVRRLTKLGYDVTYREFDGGHTVPPAIAREAFEWFMQKTP